MHKHGVEKRYRCRRLQPFWPQDQCAFSTHPLSDNSHTWTCRSSSQIKISQLSNKSSILSSRTQRRRDVCGHPELKLFADIISILKFPKGPLPLIKEFVCSGRGKARADDYRALVTRFAKNMERRGLRSGRGRRSLSFWIGSCTKCSVALTPSPRER